MTSIFGTDGFTDLLVMDAYFGSLFASLGRNMGKLSEMCLSEDEEMHTWVTEMVLSPVVYGKFSFWHGCDLVASFV